MIQNLIKNLDNSITDIKGILSEQGYDYSYGDTYSIQEIRKAIVRDEQPVFAKLESGKTVLFVGENKLNQLVVQDKNGEIFNINDNYLKKAWTGEAIIITGERDLMKCEAEKRDAVDMVLYNTSLNSWSPENKIKMDQAIPYISDVKHLDSWYLPEHPVIVHFREATEKERKEKIRSYTKGVEICIIDPSDPYTEFLHELGHVFWSSRLNNEEKEQIVLLHKKLDKDNLPPILMDNWSWDDPQELFATIYMWYLKGIQRNTGYLKILEITYNEADELLEEIFERVRKDIKSKELTIAMNKQIEKTWQDNEKDLRIYLNQAMGKAVTVKVGDRFIKAKLPNEKEFDRMRLPESVGKIKLGEYKGRNWNYIKNGVMKGMVIVTDNNGSIDFDYMDENKKYNLVPQIKSLIKANGKRYNTVSYVKPENLLRAMESHFEIPEIKESWYDKIVKNLKK